LSLSLRSDLEFVEVLFSYIISGFKPRDQNIVSSPGLDYEVRKEDFGDEPNY
jgi:hypothetical protein